jgi:hypothetical protein
VWPSIHVATADRSVRRRALDAVTTFFRALERHDVSLIEPLLTSDVMETVPFSMAGGSEPSAVLAGRVEVMSYLNTIMANFRQIGCRGVWVRDDGIMSVSVRKVCRGELKRFVRVCRCRSLPRLAAIDPRSGRARPVGPPASTRSESVRPFGGQRYRSLRRRSRLRAVTPDLGDVTYPR